MSLTDILEALPRLSERDRLVLRDRIDDLASDDWQGGEVTDADKRAILDRIEHARREPSSLVSWEDAKARMQAKVGKW